MAHSQPGLDWAKSDGNVGEWYEWLLDNRGPNTAKIYLSQLRTYFDAEIAKRFKTTAEWIAEVNGQLKTGDVKTVNKWGDEVSKWSHGSNFAENTRKVQFSAVRSFLGRNCPLPVYKFTYATKAQKIAEEKARQKLVVLSPAEVRGLVNEANSTYKAVMLVQVSAAFGVAEFIEFAKAWKEYEQQIREKSVPIKVAMVRPKTGVAYYSLLWDDAVDALHALLLERERQEGKTPEHLFVNKFGRPLEKSDIQVEVRRLADRLGLDPKVKGKLNYRIRPHEFRDFFRTQAKLANVDPDSAEFSLGHTIDKLRYNRFHQDKEGEELLRRELLKARQRLNVLSNRTGVFATGTSYYETTIRTLSTVKGIPYDDLKGKLVYYAQKLPIWPKYAKEGMAPIDVCRAMTEDDLFPAVVSLAKSLTEPAPVAEEEEMIDVDAYEKWKADGWRFHSVVNTHRIIVRRVKAS
jgi:hypothetical protein